MSTTYEFVSPATGKCVPIKAVWKDAFSSKVMGDGVCISPTEDEVVAPCDCVVGRVSEVKHAITILDTVHDIELLLCADIDDNVTNPNFSLCVEPGQTVKTGETLFTCDIEDIRAHGFDVNFPCIITSPSIADVNVTCGDVVSGQSHIMSCEYVG